MDRQLRIVHSHERGWALRSCEWSDESLHQFVWRAAAILPTAIRGAVAQELMFNVGKGDVPLRFCPRFGPGAIETVARRKRAIQQIEICAIRAF